MWRKFSEVKKNQAVLDEIIEKTAQFSDVERDELIRVLQEQKNKSKTNGEKKNVSPNIEWLKEHRNEVAGKHVALKDGKLVGQGRTIKEADQEAKCGGAKIFLLTYAPHEDEELWGGW
jgi:predicted amidophosphoribosyltransferase